MSVRLRNLTTRLVIVRLNSGRACHLGPRASSEPLMLAEVNNNAKILKLEKLHVLRSEKPSAAPSSKMKKKARPKKKRKEIIA